MRTPKEPDVDVGTIAEIRGAVVRKLGIDKVQDAKLIACVQEAVARKIDIEKIEDYVGRPATINTMRETDRSSFKLVDYCGIDPNKQIYIPGFNLSAARDVVYWVRPIKLDDGSPQAVGVAWTGEEEMKIFFMVFPPPR
jgi:hypothetical protein